MRPFLQLKPAFLPADFDRRPITTKEALNNSSLNSQDTGNIKCDYLFPLIFNRLKRSKMAARPCAAATLN